MESKLQVIFPSILVLLVIFGSLASLVLCEDHTISTNYNSEEEDKLRNPEESLNVEEYYEEDQGRVKFGTAPTLNEDGIDGIEEETTSSNKFWKPINFPAEDHIESVATKPSQHYETKLEVIDYGPEASSTTGEIPSVVEPEVKSTKDEKSPDTTPEAEIPAKPVKEDKRPNIILLMTDDQDVELGSMDYMPNTLKIFKDNGVEFRHGYVSTPMCCPSRSSLLTGLYVHNHNVYTNNDNCSSVAWREKFEKKTFAAHLYSSGYYTSYIGKYLNKYNGDHIPYGYDEWNGLLMNSRFYNYTVNRNGRRVRHGNDYLNDYYPDLIANDTLDFLSRVGSDGMKQPFLLVSSFPSPHGPEDAAPQYSSMFMNATSHHTPSYDYAPNLDKQWILRRTNEMTPVLREFTDLLMARRLQTLQSVDVAVKAIFDKLRATGLEENTYVFYTSDHGYHVGQFGLIKGKSMPYEFDIRVPFFLHGPSSIIKGGTQIVEPVMNIDLAPTFLDLAGLKVPAEMDGRSFLPLIKQYSPSHPKNPNFEWKGVFLIESSGRRELPNEATVQPATTTSSKKSKKLREERRRPIFEDNETLRIHNLCVLHPHPCLPGQKKYCRREVDRVHFKKCRSFDFIAGSYPLITDPAYQVGVLNGSEMGFALPIKKCRCRFRRDTSQYFSVDWESERRRIDEEIESLKKQIETLRQQRKEIRRKWLMSTNHQEDRNGRARNNHREEESDVYGTDQDEDDVEHDVDEESFHEPETEINHHGIHHEISTSPQPVIFEGSVDGTEPVIHASEETDDDDDDEAEDTQENIPLPAPTVITVKPTLETTTPVETSPQYNSPSESSSTTTSPATNKDDNDDQEDNPKLKEAVNQRKQEEGRDDEEEEMGLDFEGDFASFSKFPNSNQRKRFRNRPRERNKHRPKKYPDLIDQLESEDDENKCDCSNDPRWIRQKERDDRKRRKLMGKLRKKQKYMRRIEDPELRKQAETCGTEEKMNCFWHDNDHWKTAPYWNSGSFCFCMNANNNTYSCLRAVNATHNYLYCQFITGFKMYFDLRKDPYQLKNMIGTLPAAQEDWMLVQLLKLKKCKGREECWAENENDQEAIQPSIWEQIFGRLPKKKRRGSRRRQY